MRSIYERATEALAASTVLAMMIVPPLALTYCAPTPQETPKVKIHEYEPAKDAPARTQDPRPSDLEKKITDRDQNI